MNDEKEQKKIKYLLNVSFGYIFCLDQTLMVNPSLNIIWL